jgi:hypothetical protein
MASHLVIRPLQLALLGVFFLQGCATPAGNYQERHTIKNLTVVFLDEESLHREWQAMSGRQPVIFGSQSGTGIPTLKTLPSTVRSGTLKYVGTNCTMRFLDSFIRISLLGSPDISNPHQTPRVSDLYSFR